MSLRPQGSNKSAADEATSSGDEYEIIMSHEVLQKPI
jgi:hypothetical protein